MFSHEFGQWGGKEIELKKNLNIVKIKIGINKPNKLFLMNIY